MSIILRELTQEILNENGYEEFHLEINTCTKFLYMASECGKPFITMSGIKFSRTNPSKNEINSAIPFITSFFQKNKPKIDAILGALIMYRSIPEVSTKLDDTAYIETSYSKHKRDFYYVSLTLPEGISLNVSLDKLTIRSFVQDVDIPMVISHPRIAEVREYLEKYVHKQTLEQVFNNLVSDFYKCESFTI